MKKQQVHGHYDTPLMVATLALTFIGLLMVSSSSYVVAAEHYGDRYFYIKRHLIYLILAIPVFFIAAHIRLEGLRKLAWPLTFLSIALLLLAISSPFSRLAGGASRWVDIAGLRFQPSEVARLALIIFLAHFVTREEYDLRDFKKGLLFPLTLIGTITLLVLSEPDFGSAASILLTAVVVLYIAGAKVKHLAVIAIAAIPLAIVAVMGSAYRLRRLLTFLDPWQDPMDKGFQIIQSFIAIRSGGFFGKGIGDGVQKIFYLPEAHTDFAFAILGEELGFVGIFVVVALYGLFVFRGTKLAATSEDRFHALLAAGIVFTIGVQAATNMAVVMGLLPTKGLTLPFISFGGSSLIVTFAGIGLLQNIARRQRRNSV